MIAKIRAGLFRFRNEFTRSGANLVYNNSTGYYYLFVSIGACCQGVNSTYKVAVGRSTRVTGTIMRRTYGHEEWGATVLDSSNDYWKGPGGQDVYGTGIIARHAYSVEENEAPKLLISDLYWDSSGWRGRIVKGACIVLAEGDESRAKSDGPQLTQP